MRYAPVADSIEGALCCSGADSPTLRIRELLGATPYRVQVRGRNVWGEGPWGEVVVTTGPPISPTAPTNLRAEPVADAAQVSLSWMPPVRIGGAPITAYRIEASDSGEMPWQLVSETADTIYTDDGTDDHGPAFATGDWLHYRVAAVNSAGTSPFSESRYAGGDPLVVRYDTNNNGVIDRSEVIAAINDYLTGLGSITRSDVIRLINLYLSG